MITTKHLEGGRVYIDDERPDIIYPGVTSVLNMVPKGFLGPWNAKMAAELAVDSVDFTTRMAANDRKGAVEYLAGAAKRYTKTRSDIGSAAHELFELMIRGQELGTVTYEMRPYVKHFQEFLDVVKPELVDAESIAWSDTNGHAGSFDAQLRVMLNPETLQLDPQGVSCLLMDDWKTGRDIHEDVALQLSAYAFSDRIISADGSSVPMPVFDGGAVLHITDKKWSFNTVRVNRELYDIFLGLLDAYNVVQLWNGDYKRGIKGLKASVLGKPLAKSSRRYVTGTERRGA